MSGSICVCGEQTTKQRHVSSVHPALTYLRPINHSSLSFLPPFSPPSLTLGAPGGVVLRVEEEDYRLLALEGGQLHNLVLLVLEAEIGGSIAHLCIHSCVLCGG